MTHPHHEHRAHKVEKRRVGHILGHHASGGAVHHADEKADKGLVKRMVKKTALKVHGEKTKHRSDRMARARGGRTNKKGTNVTVVVAPQQAGARPVPMPPAPPPGLPPRPPVAAAPPMAAPPGAPPPGMPPAMPMRAKGGRIKSGPAWDEGVRNGTQPKNSPGKNDTKDIGRWQPITYARGGKVESPQGVDKATKLPGGSGGARARLVKERRAEKTNHPASSIYS